MARKGSVKAVALERDPIRQIGIVSQYDHDRPEDSEGVFFR
jgi:hypothetical protein